MDPLNFSPNMFIEGYAEEALPGGETMLRCPQGVVLLANAVQGDHLRVRIQQRQRGAWRGSIEQLLQASPLRIDAACPVAADCGGCALQHVSPQTQQQIKSQWVKQAFADQWHASLDWQPLTGTQGLRRRVRWWCGEDAQGLFLGFRARRSHRVVRHEHCLQLEPELDALRQRLQAFLPADLVSVQATLLHDGIHLVLESKTAKKPAQPWFEQPGLLWWWRTEQGSQPIGKVHVLHDVLSVEGQQLGLHIGPDDFVQGQFLGNTALVEQLQSWAKGAYTVADLFSGVGNLSLPLAFLGMHVEGAELRPQSVQAANRNAKRLAVSATYRTADLSKADDLAFCAGVDVLILDPPRQGARAVCLAIPALLPKKIVLVSCDVAAAKRDAALLNKAGYRLTAVRALDLFPVTGHVESMSLWLRV